MALLEAQNITKIYTMGDTQLTVLHTISCSIEKGEFLSITGPSGSGKSTLMNIIGCLDIPTTGKYFVEGKDVSLLTPNQLAHIRNKKVGFVFQQFNLLPDLTALDNVALPQLYGDKSEKEARTYARQVLEMVDLSDRQHHYPYQLSGGQQQRVAIARALSNKPEIVLADEPTGNLDSKTGEMIMNIFINLNKSQNITVILISHDLTLAKKTNRIIQLLDGKIISDQQNLTT